MFKNLQVFSFHSSSRVFCYKTVTLLEWLIVRLCVFILEQYETKLLDFTRN